MSGKLIIITEEKLHFILSEGHQTAFVRGKALEVVEKIKEDSLSVISMPQVLELLNSTFGKEKT